MSVSGIVNKVWSYVRALRDNVVAYGDYVEQLETVLEEFRSVEDVLATNDA
jgi:hypothetical protein